MENYSCKIKSLIVKDISNVENLCRAVVVATELQRLELLLLPTVESNSSDYIPILSLRKQQNLEVLKLEGSFERRLVCLRLPNPKRARLQILRRLVCLQLINPETVQLRIITLRNLTMRYVETEQLFRSLSSYSRLEQLTFDDLRCCDRDCLPVVDLRKHHHLRDLQLKKLSVEGLLIPNQQDTAMRVLRLYSVKMTHNDIQSLYVSLPSSSALENLGLINLSCSDHSDRDCLLPVLNLQKHHNLEKLILEKLSVECLLIPNQQDTEMRTLRLDSVKMTHHDIQSLCVSLSSWSALEHLWLNNLSCSDHSDRDCLLPVLDLQKHPNLEILSLEKLSIEGLLIPHQQDTAVRGLWLDSVTMTHHDIQSLCVSLSSWSALEYLELINLSCSDHSDRDCLLPMLDLQKHHNLKDLRRKNLSVEGLLTPIQQETAMHTLWLDNVTMTHHDIQSLCVSLSSWSALEHLWLNNLSCSDHSDRDCPLPVLDLQKHHNLEKLILEKLSVECLLIPNQQDTEMRTLWLDSVTMTHHDIQSLCASLSSWSALENLRLINLSCSDHSDRDCLLPVLDLQKHHNLEDLRLEKLSVECLLIPNQQDTAMRGLWLHSVTMTHHDIQSLCVSLSSWSALENLGLINLSCSDHNDRCWIYRNIPT